MVSKFPGVLTSLHAPIVSHVKLEIAGNTSILLFAWCCLSTSLFVANGGMNKAKSLIITIWLNRSGKKLAIDKNTHGKLNYGWAFSTPTILLFDMSQSLFMIIALPR